MSRRTSIVLSGLGLVLLSGTVVPPFAAAADNAPPATAITTPSDGAVVSGLLEVIADASDDVGVTSVDLLVNGIVKGTDKGEVRGTGATGPYEFLWLSTQLDDGFHTLVTRAHDAAGNTADSTAVPIEVRNADAIPIMDLGTNTYKGFAGGLYPGGSNAPPADHFNAGVARANAVVPLDTNGNPNAGGKYVMMSIGFSSPLIEFCTGVVVCDPDTFKWQADLDPQVNHSSLVIVNGAIGGAPAPDWDSPADYTYNKIRDEKLPLFGVTEKQVQVIWAKVTNRDPTKPLPDPDADAYRLETTMGNIVRTLKFRYPNLKLVFFSTRIYGGYSNVPLAPEPYAYENGFAAKWLIQAQIDQMVAGQIVDERAGDLNYDNGLPRIAWGPYLWANGTTPRSDGLFWHEDDIGKLGVHPDPPGIKKVGDMLMNFFKNDPAAAPWFLDQSGPPDTVPPIASMTAPSAGASVSGVVQVAASAEDDVGVTNVELLVDGVVRGSDTTSPYEIAWNSGTVSNGPHSLLARAHDAAGNTGESAPVNVEVSNTADTSAPTASVTAPLEGSAVSGTVAVVAAAEDDVGVSNVEFLVDGTVRGSDAAAPYEFPWDTTSVPNGLHTLVARAHDAAGNTGDSTPANITVSNTPSGTLTVTLRATPASGVSSLLDVDLAAVVKGTATGPITYTYYCNRSDNGTDVQPGWAVQIQDTTATKHTAVDACDYSAPGIYWAKVIVTRGGLAATAKVKVTVT
jgi:hypothetical protein